MTRSGPIGGHARQWTQAAAPRIVRERISAQRSTKLITYHEPSGQFGLDIAGRGEPCQVIELKVDAGIRGLSTIKSISSKAVIWLRSRGIANSLAPARRTAVRGQLARETYAQGNPPWARRADPTTAGAPCRGSSGRQSWHPCTARADRRTPPKATNGRHSGRELDRASTADGAHADRPRRATQRSDRAAPRAPRQRERADRADLKPPRHPTASKPHAGGRARSPARRGGRVHRARRRPPSRPRGARAPGAARPRRSDAARTPRASERSAALRASTDPRR